MAGDEKQQVLQIKKYPNRRFYDATRSRHVTLQEVFELVSGGQDVVITDSKSGEDITNLILTQILLEKDPPRLNLFPSWVFHMLIRTNQHVLRNSMDRYFGPFLSVMSTSQKQFEGYMKQTFGSQFITPMDWASNMMRAFVPGPAADSNGGSTARDAEPPPENVHFPGGADATEPGEDSLDDLRAQVAELNQRIERMAPSGDPGSPTPQPAPHDAPQPPTPESH